MPIDVLYSYARFEALKANWDAVYQKDPDANFFLSWLWLSRIFQQHPNEWCILAVRPEESAEHPYVAFFPLRRRTDWDAGQRRFSNRLAMAGSLFWSDYTGLLCDPAHDDDAIPALARHLKKLHWQELVLKNIRISDRRLALLTQPFENSVFNVRSRERTSKHDGIDLLSCPYVDLPGDFDAYLNESLSANMRQKVRRFLRRVEAGEELRVSISGPQTLQHDLDMLTGHWKERWAERKGEEVDDLTSTYRRILEQAANAGCLFMPILWHGETAVGALACLIDRCKRQLLFFVAGRDVGFRELPSGLVLHAYSIRWAIEQGFGTYEFLRGDEPYKLSFGATRRSIRFIIIRTRSGANLNRTLDPRSIDVVLEKSTRYMETGRPERAAAGFRQILEISPEHATVLRRYARLLYGQRDYTEAAAMYARYADVRAGEPLAWQGLGRALLALNDFEAAGNALRQAIALRARPVVGDFIALGRALQGQERMEEARGAFQSALELEPEDAVERRLQREAREHLAPDAAANPPVADEQR